MARVLVSQIRDDRKNYLMNGNMGISQRATSFASVGNATYSLDRYRYDKSGAMVHTISQDTSDVPTLAQAGVQFPASLRLNLTTPDTSIAAGDRIQLSQYIEGVNFLPLVGKDFTFSFWVKATLAGTYCISIRNGAPDRSYVAEYVINSANTWEKKTINVPAAPTSGTWDYTTGIGLRLGFTLASGTTFQTTANSWQTGDFIATANQVNGTNTGATDFRITGLMLNEGNTAAQFRLHSTDAILELNNCQRYLEQGSMFRQVGTAASNETEWVNFAVNKRIAGGIQMTQYLSGTFNSSSFGSFQNANQSGVAITINFAAPTGNCLVHWRADCEL